MTIRGQYTLGYKQSLGYGGTSSTCAILELPVHRIRVGGMIIGVLRHEIGIAKHEHTTLALVGLKHLRCILFFENDFAKGQARLV